LDCLSSFIEQYWGECNRHQLFAAPKVAFSASVPVQLPKTTASTRDHAIRFKEAAIASRSLSMNQRVIDLFCAQVSGIRKGQGWWFWSPAFENTRHQANVTAPPAGDPAIPQLAMGVNPSLNGSANLNLTGCRWG
jgi:hypothetical protein